MEKWKITSLCVHSSRFRKIRGDNSSRAHIDADQEGLWPRASYALSRHCECSAAKRWMESRAIQSYSQTEIWAEMVRWCLNTAKTCDARGQTSYVSGPGVRYKRLGSDTFDSIEDLLSTFRHQVRKFSCLQIFHRSWLNCSQISLSAVIERHANDWFLFLLTCVFMEMNVLAFQMKDIVIILCNAVEITL